MYFLLQVPISFALTLFITEDPQVKEHVVQDPHSLQEQLSELRENNDMFNQNDTMASLIPTTTMLKLRIKDVTNCIKDGTNYNEITNVEN